MHKSPWAWSPTAADRKRLAKAERLAERNRELIANGSKQPIDIKIGAKSRPLSKPFPPVYRRSVIG